MGTRQLVMCANCAILHIFNKPVWISLPHLINGHELPPISLWDEKK